MLQTIRNALKIPELRMKLLFTLLIILLYRLGSAIPVPFIDSVGMQEIFKTQSDTIFGYMNIMSGNAFSRATLFALSITPYITSSIVMQLLTIAIPALEKLQKSGDDGRKVITQITRYVTVLLGLITGYGYYVYCNNIGMVNPGTVNPIFVGVVIVACYSAGSALIMWLGEKINENGIGNGISMILFANIISVVPSALFTQVEMLVTDIRGGEKTAGEILLNIGTLVLVLAIAVVIVAFVVFMSNAEHRVPVQYSKRMVGRKMYGGQSTFLPIKINMSGVMPIIFANSIVMIPITIIQFIDPNPASGTVLGVLHTIFGTTSVLYMVLTFALIIAFSFFYISISFNPIEVSNNLKKNGGFVPGIRPGKPTTDFITRILNKTILIGGVFLGVIAIIPILINLISSLFGSSAFAALTFGGTSVLIVVGVALETSREIEAQMSMRHYKGFLQ